MSVAAVRGRAAWSPARIPSLALWLSASKIGGLSDGGAVATWPDTSGGGRDATQGTGGSQPSWETGELNGRPVVRFDGAADHLNVSLSSGPTSSTVFVVAKKTALAAAGAMLGSGAGGGGLEFRVVQTTGTLMLLKSLVAVIATSTGTIAAGGFHVLEFSYVTSGAYTFFIDGTDAGSGNSAQTLLTSNVIVGATDGPAVPWDGDIAEIVRCDAILDAATRAVTRRYLGAAYAITVA